MSCEILPQNPKMNTLNMKNKIDYSSIIQTYKEITSKYEKLGLNISQAIELLLNEEKIPYLSIDYRTKDVDSFVGKIQRKSYKNPFEDIEDICGLRIICYYQSDIEKIKNIIQKEFEILNNENKVENLDFDQFGYRSFHFILKIKNEWLKTPNYRGLENIKAELQIRTILMHAWAEIEHKLAYKTESQIPKEFRRKLSRISAKLEESDEQFEDLKNEIEDNKHNIIESAKESKIFYSNIEFNLDSLQAFLDFAFPERTKEIKQTIHLFDEMVENKISLKTLAEGFEKAKNIFENVEKEEIFFHHGHDNEITMLYAQVGAARTVLELVDDKYYQERKTLDESKVITKYRAKIK
jgi:putative GTP pyrophosphokinase